VPWQRFVYQHPSSAASLDWAQTIGRLREGLCHSLSLPNNTLAWLYCIFDTVNMDIQSLEARFENISVHDENHENALKSKVLLADTSLGVEYLANVIIGFVTTSALCIESRNISITKSTQATTSETRKRQRSKGTNSSRRNRHKDHPSFTSSTTIFRCRKKVGSESSARAGFAASRSPSMASRHV